MRRSQRHTQTSLEICDESFKIADMLEHGELLAIERVGRLGVIHLNPTPPLQMVIGVRILPTALCGRYGQPQPIQVPPRCWWSGILILGPSMQHMHITNKLNIAHIQHHMQTQQFRRILEHLHCLLLRLAERRDVSCIDVTLDTLEVVGIVGEDESVIGLTTTEVYDGTCNPTLLLACVGGDLTFAIEMPDVACEQFGHVRTVGLKVIPHGVDETMSDSPPSTALCRHSRPTIPPDESVWKNCRALVR